MFRVIRPRLMIPIGAAILVMGTAALAGTRLLAGEDVPGDPDLDTSGVVSVCSDVKVHARVTVNIGTVERPDDRTHDYDLDATGHDRDPFSRRLDKACTMTAGAFESRVELEAPGLNQHRPLHVIVPADSRHVRVVRITRHADGAVTSTQEVVAAR
ncbi:hypothetical protein ACH3Y9_05390 [Streptomyces sp. WSLK1-5]|uniref:hypothetical protein n=1 Tax=unclassified Streptomyces TaxID=2593676 RepID=UPI0037AF83F2